VLQLVSALAAVVCGLRAGVGVPQAACSSAAALVLAAAEAEAADGAAGEVRGQRRGRLRAAAAVTLSC
jgi:hypothetical protein